MTTDELAREAEQEATVFAQAANIDKLVDMLRSFDPSQDNLADNDDIQVNVFFLFDSCITSNYFPKELYRSSMALRPKIVKLIDKYSQKRGNVLSVYIERCSAHCMDYSGIGCDEREFCKGSCSI